MHQNRKKRIQREDQPFFRPAALLGDIMQTVQTLFRCRVLRRLNWGCTICLQKFPFQIRWKWKHPPWKPKTTNEIQMIRMDKSTCHKWVKINYTSNVQTRKNCNSGSPTLVAQADVRADVISGCLMFLFLNENLALLPGQISRETKPLQLGRHWTFNKMTPSKK